MLFGQTSNCLQVFLQIYSIVVECLFDNSHCVFQRIDFALELDEFFGERVLRVTVGVDVVRADCRRRLRLINNFLQLLVFLIQGIDIAINDRESTLEVIDLVIEDLVVCMNGHLAVDQSIDSLGDLKVVLSVDLLYLLHEGLRRTGSLLVVLLLLLGLMLLVLLGNLTTPSLCLLGCASHRCDRSPTRWLHQKSRARVRHRLHQSVIGAPVSHRLSFDLHVLLVDVRELHQGRLLHLHIEVDARRRHRVSGRQDDFERVAGGCRPLDDQVVRFRFIREA